MHGGWLRVVLLCSVVFLLACVRVEVQRVSTSEPAPPMAPTATPRPIEHASETPQPAVVVHGDSESHQPTRLLRALFRYRMPPATALQIQRLGIDVPIVEVASVKDGKGWYWPVPDEAAAHLAGTANPGEPGNIAITGHVDTTHGPGAFWRLLDIRPGDEVTVWSAAGSFVYRVTEVKVVPETDRTVLRQGDREVLTLLTCVPDGRYDRRLVVRAEPVRPAVAAR
ncbi:class D sortase [Thermomicrobium sp. 4228-Ro]|uniref:sortase n=1 Tax=Thermomicrobium sp. 4228-Ro TaxID=2993937 RepID=UPI00224996DB|nr:class D sortase [Thermomicrobium sp. 4228-Ro]MCX2728222.1 class D sortase [Thermomicrobium sp. 4228-Ro]